jgi:DNA helicase II / ATP-dependent DNA helicase PcrA
MQIVEPIYKALETSDMQLLFDTLRIRRYPITSKSDKMKWRILKEHLEQARTQKSIDVLKIAIESQLIPISQQVFGYYELYQKAPDTSYSNTTIKFLLDLEYKQFLAAIEFLYPEAEFSTEHGVKGEEYDNVVFVISNGWNQYQFEIYAPMINNGVPPDKEDSFVRNRNLFYVCCSRPKKRLYFFISIQIDETFRNFLEGLVGKQNIVTYSQFING